MELKNKMEEKKQKLIWRVDFLKEERDIINRELLYLERLINFRIFNYIKLFLEYLIILNYF